MNRDTIAKRMEELQSFICNELERVDGKAVFHFDPWIREGGGGGKTATLKDGNILEKGGVAFSAVHGPVTELMKTQMGLSADSFFATGVSIVLHPKNPHVPIIHMNVRYFELSDGQFWFGGGIDLTPHYIVPANAVLFHQYLKNICDKYHVDFYPEFKNWADDYFFIPHRNETRGIGGIFFDHQKEDKISKEELFKFCIELGENFPYIYEQQVVLTKDKEFSTQELEWRNLRRGRYVEFNLVHDRGTKFGLVSGGRTESILMSLPSMAQWDYNFKPLPNSPEAITQNYLKKGINWLN